MRLISASPIDGSVPNIIRKISRPAKLVTNSRHVEMIPHVMAMRVIHSLAPYCVFERFHIS